VAAVFRVIMRLLLMGQAVALAQQDRYLFMFRNKEKNK